MAHQLSKLNINVVVCYVSAVSSSTYAQSFMNDAESCWTRKSDDMIRQEV